MYLKLPGVGRLRIEYLIDSVSHATLVVTKGNLPSALLQVVGGVAHDNGNSREFKHFNIVVIVAYGHDLGARVAAVGGPALERVSLGTALVEDVHDAEVARFVLSTQDGDLVVEVALEEMLLRLLHAFDGAAEHSLDGVLCNGTLDRTDEFDELGVLLHPTLDRAVEFVGTFHDQRALVDAIEGKDRVGAEIAHVPNEVNGDRGGKQVLVKEFSGTGAGDSAIGADEGDRETERFRDGKGEGVATSGDECDLDSLSVSAGESLEISGRDLELRVE